MSKLLIVGTGSIGERHVRCFQQTGRAEIAICEIDADLRERVADRYGLQQAYGDLEAALKDAFDAVVICTPANLHIPMAIRAAQSGAHLLIEKPLSTSEEGVGALRRVLADRRLATAVAYVYRAHPGLVAMKQALAEGRFGRPVQLVAHCGQHFPTYRPAYRQIYYTDRATGGGAIQDALTHIMNAGEWLVGPIHRLVADADHQVLEGVEVEDTVHVMARHGSVMGCYSLNQHQAPNEVSMTVIGDRGAARFEFHRQRWRWMTEPGGLWTDESIGELQRDELFVIQADRFLDILQEDATPLCTLEDAFQSLQVNQAILRSLDSQRWEPVALRES